jgi:hypothetical protein
MADSDRSKELQHQLLQDPWEKGIKDLENIYRQGSTYLLTYLLYGAENFLRS